MNTGCTTRPYQELDFPRACAAIAAAGFSEVAVYYNASAAGTPAIPVTAQSTAADVAAARQAASAAGLTPSLLLGGWQPDLELAAAIDDYRRLIDNAAALGACWLLDLGCDQRELRADYLALMQAVAPHAEAAGITITLKPHGGIALTAADLLALYGTVAHPAFRLCFDPGNFIYYSAGAIRPEDCVDALAPHCATAIIKDCVLGPGGPDVMVTPGEGLVDFPQIFRQLRAGGFSGPVYLECVAGNSADDRDENVRRTRTRALGW
ncbi:sugar phosphate isomerase/epimerase family protein [Chitinilyticum aquatile]|uniref:sugar phosphate isomerase/epimerase family protein n=1 Tax=Chitinilyticum aquatile TaxID=362520 RepID=UPI000424C7AE|nr:TIM barrel protein [Chitinilyticum aquatile]